MLDLCTGSGCIALSLALMGKYGKIHAIDLSKEALKVAEKNKKQLLYGEMQEKVVFLEGDLFAALGINDSYEDDVPPVAEKAKLHETKYDLFVSNPPYIPTDVIEGIRRKRRRLAVLPEDCSGGQAVPEGWSVGIPGNRP